MNHIAAVLNRESRSLFPCLREEIIQSGFSGSISISFVVNNDGRVGEVWIHERSLRDGEMQACFERQMSGWRFNSFEGARPTVNHSFTVGSEQPFAPRPPPLPTQPETSTDAPTDRQGDSPPDPGPRDRDLPREVSRGDIMQVVSSKRGDLRNCVNRQRAADPDLSGTVVMGWRVQSDGNSTAIRVKSEEHHGTVMAQCLTEVIETMHFPRYGGPQMAEVEFPFLF